MNNFSIKYASASKCLFTSLNSKWRGRGRGGQGRGRGLRLQRALLSKKCNAVKTKTLAVSFSYLHRSGIRQSLIILCTRWGIFGGTDRNWPIIHPRGHVSKWKWLTFNIKPTYRISNRGSRRLCGHALLVYMVASVVLDGYISIVNLN